MRAQAIKVSYSRKDGRSNYGSEGASAEITLDLEEGEDPAAALAAAGQLARAAVLQQLSDDGPAAAAIVAAAPAPPPPHPTAATSSGAAAAAATRRTWQPRVTEAKRNGTGGHSSKRGSAAGAHNGLPKCGAELYPWAKRLQDEGQEGLIQQIKDWGAQRNLPWKLTDWPAEYVDALVAELRDLAPQTA